MKKKTRRIILVISIISFIIIIILGFILFSYLSKPKEIKFTNGGFTLGVNFYDLNGNKISSRPQTTIRTQQGIFYISFKILGSNVGLVPLSGINIKNTLPVEFNSILSDQTILATDLAVEQSNTLLYDTATLCATDLECSSSEKCINNQCLFNIRDLRGTISYSTEIEASYIDAYGISSTTSYLLVLPITFNSDVFTDDFESLIVGQGSTFLLPNYIPQYSSKVSVTDINTKEIYVDAYTPFGGDRDIHVELTKTNLFPLDLSRVNVSVDYKVVEWNTTSTVVIGNAIYLHYVGGAGSNFISGEWKVNKLTGTGLAQLSTFKRVNGVSTTLCTGSCPTFTSTIGQRINSKMEMYKEDENNYRVNFYTNNVLMVSNTVPISEVLPGKILPMEATATKVYYDNLEVIA